MDKRSGDPEEASSPLCALRPPPCSALLDSPSTLRLALAAPPDPPPLRFLPQGGLTTGEKSAITRAMRDNSREVKFLQDHPEKQAAADRYREARGSCPPRHPACRPAPPAVVHKTPLGNAASLPCSAHHAAEYASWCCE